MASCAGPGSRAAIAQGGGVEVLPEAPGLGEEGLEARALGPLAVGVGEVAALGPAQPQAGEDDGPLRLEEAWRREPRGRTPEGPSRGRVYWAPSELQAREAPRAARPGRPQAASAPRRRREPATWGRARPRGPPRAAGWRRAPAARDGPRAGRWRAATRPASSPGASADTGPRRRSTPHARPAAARLRRAWSTARGSRSQAMTSPRPSATQAWASRPEPQPASTRRARRAARR